MAPYGKNDETSRRPPALLGPARSVCDRCRTRVWILAAAVVPVLCLTDAGAARAGHDPIEGPVRAEVLRVVDGDTVEVRAHIWPGQTVRVLVRLRHVDTPELRSRCAEERRKAEEARRLTARLLTAVPHVYLHDIANDKYGGRIAARVTTADGRDLQAALLASGLARPYAGDRRATWCS